MNFEGKVTIDLGGGGDAPVRVDYRQPVKIARILTGKAPKVLPGLMSSVYSVCGHAQAHASVLALEAAMGGEGAPLTSRSRAVLTALETWRETLLRIALEWPDMTGGKADTAAARRAMALLPAMKTALFGAADPYLPGASSTPDLRAALALVEEAEELAGQCVLGEVSERFLARRGEDGLSSWAWSRDTQAARFVRHLFARGFVHEAEVEAHSLDLPADATRLDRWLEAAGRDATTGAVPETTPFSRRRGDPLVASLGSCDIGARYAARLAELARLPLEMRDLLAGAAQVPAISASINGEGVAVVEAARGLLAHAARIEDGMVADYRIVAPTDWNFHARGIAAQCLAKLEDHADREVLAHLVVRAIDPCVAYEIHGLASAA